MEWQNYESLLLAVRYESTIKPIAALASKAAALFETALSNQQQMDDYSVRTADPVTPRLGILQSGHPSIFKSQTGFWAEEFDWLRTFS
jgi:hypothetical protein